MHLKKDIFRRLKLLFIVTVLVISNFLFLPSDISELFFTEKSAVAVDEPYRCYLEYTLDNGISSDKTAGILRKTIIYVYAKKGETICLGSDIFDSRIATNETVSSNSTGADIVLITPDNKSVSFDTVENGKGYIGNVTQENNPPAYWEDPEYKGSSGDYYNPHQYTVTKDGIYEIRFHSYTGNRAVTSTATHRRATLDPAICKLSSNDWKNTSCTVGAWDVTVVDKNEQNPDKVIKTGRAYTKCLCLNVGDNNGHIFDNYYVVTDDGYIYRTEFQNLDPFGFVFFANNRGLVDTDTGNSAYHSYNTAINDLSALYNELGITFQSPNSKDTETDKTFRIFFEEPDPELEEIPRAYVPDEISDIEFIGSKCDNISYTGDGGYFKFTVGKATSATVTVSFDKYNDLHGTNYTPVSITQNTSSGDNYFYWDGCDGSGTIIPKGVYNQEGIDVEVVSHAGEYHFPLFDVEACAGRVIVERVNKIYKREVDDDGNVFDIDVTDDFANQRYSLYYNNELAPDVTFTRNQIITDEQLKYVEKYSAKVGPLRSTEFEDSYFNGNTHNGSGFFPVRYFNLEATMREFGITEEEALALYESAIAGENVDAYFDYYLIIADQFDYSGGMDSNADSAMNFPSQNSCNLGDMTALDMWTYALGKPLNATLKQDIVIVDIEGYLHANIQGMVFFDTNKDSYYKLSDGDYSIAGVEVQADYTYSETRWKENIDEETGSAYLVCDEDESADGKKYALYPTETEGIYNLKINDEWSMDGDVRKEYKVTKKEIENPEEEPTEEEPTEEEPAEEKNVEYSFDIHITLKTKTDANGIYRFTGILVSEESSELGDFKINITKPSALYTNTTENTSTGDFGTEGEEGQKFNLSELYDLCCSTEESSPVFDMADVGYYYEEYEPPVILKKSWESDESFDDNHPDHVTFHIVGIGNGTILYSDDIDIYYYDNSWSKTLEHLPKCVGGVQLTYKIAYEYFEKDGVYYKFDGEEYTDSDGNVIDPPPYSSEILTVTPTHTATILEVVNSPLSKSIEITKRADDDRSVLVEGAKFRVEKYNPDTNEWVTYEDEVVTNKYGLISLSDVDNGTYRFTETFSPDLYRKVEPFEIEVNDTGQVFKKTIYEPLSEVRLTLKKKFTSDNDVVVVFPEQELTFHVEMSYDEDFSQKLDTDYEITISPEAKKSEYPLFENIVIPNCDEDTSIYVRITEENAGSYTLNSATVKAKSNQLPEQYIDRIIDNSDRSKRSITFELQKPTENGSYSEYTVQLENKADFMPTLRFQKRWLGSDLKKTTPTGILAVYASLWRKTNTSEPEQVLYALGGNSNSSGKGKFVSVGESVVSGDAEWVNKGCFGIKSSAWTKNFTNPSWFYFPAYAPDGSKYTYFIKEETNEKGNPLCVFSGPDTLDYAYEYKVINADEYTESFAEDANGMVTKVTITTEDGKTIIDNESPHSAKVNGKDITFYSEKQSNYFILNRYAPDITLQVTKNQWSDTDTENPIPLKNAEFTLYSDENCTKTLALLKTDVNGIGQFEQQLEYGKTYYMKETKAPSGYVIDNEVFRLDYKEAKKITITHGDSVITQETSASEQFVVNITCTNTLNITIPEVGTDCTSRKIAVTGVVLMGIAVLLALIFYKRIKGVRDG